LAETTNARPRIDREALKQLEAHFDSFIIPFLDDTIPEDVHLAWEFEKFVHTKKLMILTAEKQSLKRLKDMLSSR